MTTPRTADDLRKLVRRFDPKATFWNETAPVGPVLDRLARNGAWLGAQRFPALEYHVPGIVPEGLGLLVAAPKKGKSWMVADIGLGVAGGTPVFGAVPVAARPVLYLALEDGHRRLQSRCRRILGFGVSIPAGISFVTKATPAEAIAAIGEFMTRHAAEKPLVILDTLGKVKPQKKPGEESYLADYKVGTELKDIVDAVPGASLLVVHHTRKAETGDFVDSVSGTQGIAGSVDYVLVLSRKRHENKAILSVTGRDIVESEYAMTAEGGVLWRLDGADLDEAHEAVAQRRAEQSVGDRSMEVYLAVQAAQGPITAADVAAQVPDMDNDDAGKYLRRLHAGGHIHKPRRGFFSIHGTPDGSAPGGQAGGFGHQERVSDTQENPVSETNTTPDQAQQANSDTPPTSDTVCKDADDKEPGAAPSNTVSEVGEVSETGQTCSSEGISDSDTAFSGVSECPKQDTPPSNPSASSITPPTDAQMKARADRIAAAKQTQQPPTSPESYDGLCENCHTEPHGPDSIQCPACLEASLTPPAKAPMTHEEIAARFDVIGVKLGIVPNGAAGRVRGVIVRRLQKVGAATRSELRVSVNSRDRQEFNAVFGALVAEGRLVADDGNQGKATRWRLASP